MSTHGQQKIHPTPPDVEAPAPSSAPLMSPNTIRSDSKVDDRAHDHHQYPPRPQRTLPSTYPPRPRRRRSKRSSCCRALCCILCTLLVLIIAIGAALGILFLIFRPKIPDYSIDTLRVTDFSPNLSNNSIYATFAVNISTHNPNKNIGIYYLGGSTLSAFYQDTLLCEGNLPKFYQGHRNTTVLDVPLTGTINDASQFSSALQQQQQQTGNIPLMLRANVPVKIKLGKLKLMKMRFRVKCELEIDQLASNQQIRVGRSNCKFRIRRIF